MKVKCKVCANESKSMCRLRKSGIKVNKPRLCDDFIYDPLKVKVHTEIPVVKFGYAEQQAAKKYIKEERARIVEAARKGTLIADEERDKQVIYNDNKYPLTGDLSRFTTTAAEAKED